VESLTVAQLAQLASGEIRSWKEVGGDEAPVVFVDRDKKSRVRKSFIDVVLGSDDVIHGAREVDSHKDMDAAIKANRSAIGFVSLAALTKDVKAIAVDGVPFSRATLLSGRYPLTRSFYLAVYLKPTALAEQLVEFTLSTEGQSILEADGLIGVH
jgi:phosphate transport system substrate-binding protein